MDAPVLEGSIEAPFLTGVEDLRIIVSTDYKEPKWNEGTGAVEPMKDEDYQGVWLTMYFARNGVSETSMVKFSCRHSAVYPALNRADQFMTDYNRAMDYIKALDNVEVVLHSSSTDMFPFHAGINIAWGDN